MADQENDGVEARVNCIDDQAQTSALNSTSILLENQETAPYGSTQGSSVGNKNKNINLFISTSDLDLSYFPIYMLGSAETKALLRKKNLYLHMHHALFWNNRHTNIRQMHHSLFKLSSDRKLCTK